MAEQEKNPVENESATQAQKDYEAQLKEALNSASIISAENPPEGEMMPDSREKKQPPQSEEELIKKQEIAERQKREAEKAPEVKEEITKEEAKIRANVSALERMAKEREDYEKSLREQKPEAAPEVLEVVPELKPVAEGVEQPKITKEQAFEFLSNPDLKNESPEKLAEYFEALTGRRLDTEANAKADAIFEKVGIDYMYTNETKEEMFQREQAKIQDEQRNIATSGIWDRLSEKDKARIGDIGSDNFKIFIAKKAEKLGLKESEFLSLASAGWAPEKIEKGWFSGFKIIDTHWHYPLNVSKKEFYKAVASIQTEQSEKMKAIAIASADVRAEKNANNEKAFQAVRGACVENIIIQALAAYSAEKQQKVEGPVVKETREEESKIVVEFNNKRTPEQIEQMVALRKEAEAQMKEQKERRDNIAKMLKKQRAGDLLTKKEVIALNQYWGERAEKTKRQSKKVA